MEKTNGWLLTDQNRQYIPASNTDILRAFKAMGWVAPSEAKQTAQKAANQVLGVDYGNK